MQLVGTRESIHQAGRVGALGLGEGRRAGSEQREDWAVPAQALGVDDAGCSAGPRSVGPAGGDRGQPSAASQGTRYGRSAPNAPHMRWRWVPARVSPALWCPPSGIRRRTTAELPVTVAEEAHRPALLAEHHEQVAGLLGDPGGVGVGGHPGQVDPTSAQFDEEQHVQPAQPDGVDGEEVAGDDRGGLPAQERPPGGGRRPRCGVQPVAAQRGADCGCRDAFPKPEQLALDALVAQRGFSLASRTIRSCSCWSSGGRPVPRCG